MNKVSSFLILTLLIASGILFYGDFFVDDAYITLRYARNTVNGYGLSFNPTDTIPIEGYTNFGWLLLQLPLLLFTTSPEIILGILSVFTLLLTSYILNNLTFKDWHISPAVFLMMSFHSFWFWNTSGLETGMMGALILLWNIIFYRQYIKKAPTNENANTANTLLATTSFACPAIAFFSLLTRPDCLIILFWQWSFLLAKKNYSALKAFSIRFTALVIPYALFKLIYFGKLLPNTFYAKANLKGSVLHRGSLYLMKLLTIPEIIILIIGIVVSIYLVLINRKDDLSSGNEHRSCESDSKHRSCESDSEHKSSKSDNEHKPCSTGFQINNKDLLSFWIFTLLILGSYLLYIVKVGGDYLPFYRFLYPVIPWCIYMCSHSLLKATMSKQKLIVFCLMPVLFLTTSFDCFHEAAAFWTDQKVLISASKQLAKLVKPNTKTVTLASGIINYYCDFNATDFYGLTDPGILRKNTKHNGNKTFQISSIAGHDNYDLDFVKTLNPEIIIPHFWYPIINRKVIVNPCYKPDNSGQYYFTGLKELVEAPFISKDYVKKRLLINSGSLNLAYIYYVRKKKRTIKDK